MQFDELFTHEYWQLYVLGVLVFSLLVVFTCVLCWRSRGKARSGTPGTGGLFRQKSFYVESLASELTPAGHKHWRALLGMSMGDAQRAKRLVLHESKFAPNAQMDDLIERAIDRYHRDIRG